MTTYFADSYFWFALTNPRDDSHALAKKYAQVSARLVTTAWVITELAGKAHPGETLQSGDQNP